MNENQKEYLNKIRQTEQSYYKVEESPSGLFGFLKKVLYDISYGIWK